MAITNFISEIWSAAVAEALQESAVLAPITNRQYEGEATKGNTVHVTGVVPPTITDYAAAGRTTTAEDQTDDGDAVPIDQEKSFDFHVDDIDRVQAAGSFEAWTTAAGRALANDADSYIGAQMIAGGTDAAFAGDVTDSTEAHDAVVQLRKQLNQANVPAGQRFLAMNAEFEALFLAADSKITSVDTSGTAAGLREAIIGRYMGFTLVTSNLLPEQTFAQVVAFWQPAFAYISQIDKVEGLRSHTKFADRVRGLHVYGAQVLDVNTYAEAVRFHTNIA
jgi:hypothetical protein